MMIYTKEQQLFPAATLSRYELNLAKEIASIVYQGRSRIVTGIFYHWNDILLSYL
jgi:hypothetical protein